MDIVIVHLHVAQASLNLTSYPAKQKSHFVMDSWGCMCVYRLYTMDKLIKNFISTES